jgi:hypothetical protein
LATYTPRGPDDGHDDELKDGIQIDGELGNLLADMRNVNKQPLAAVAICLLSMPIPADRRWVPVA